MAGVLIPVAVFAAVILIVGIVSMTRIHSKEIDVQQTLHLEELDHRRRMQELENELARVREASKI